MDNLAHRSFEGLKLALITNNPAQATNISIIFRIDIPKITAYDLQNSTNNISGYKMINAKKTIPIVGIHGWKGNQDSFKLVANLFKIENAQEKN